MLAGDDGGSGTRDGGRVAKCQGAQDVFHPSRTDRRRVEPGRTGQGREAIAMSALAVLRDRPAPVAPATAAAIALHEVRKVHGKGDGAVTALDGVSVGLPTGSFTAVMGPSGSG